MLNGEILDGYIARCASKCPGCLVATVEGRHALTIEDVTRLWDDALPGVSACRENKCGVARISVNYRLNGIAGVESDCSLGGLWAKRPDESQGGEEMAIARFHKM